MNLRDIANSAAVMDGQLTLWMMPYLTLRNDIVLTAFDRIIPRNERPHPDGDGVLSDWSLVHNTFVICEGVLVDVEVSSDASKEARAFAHYWQQRGDDLRANWDLFTALTGGRVFGALWEAYNATRDTSYDAADGLNANAEQVEALDPEAVGG